ncbi:MAG: hypothetical protein ACYCS7_14545 [Acidimicrobiales bacterium]
MRFGIHLPQYGRAAGLDHLMVSPTQDELDSWLASAEALWVALDRIYQ